MSEVDIPDKYGSLKQRIGAMDMPAFATVLPVANTLKSVVAVEPTEWSNNAHIAYNTGWIADVSGRILVPSLQQEVSRPDLSPADKQKVQVALDEAIAIRDDAEKLNEKSENSTTPEDVIDEVGDYTNAASYSQIMFAEIEQIVQELNGNGDIEKVNGIAQSIVDKAPELGKPAGRAPQSIASKFKEAIGAFKTTLENKFKSIKEKITEEAKGTLGGLLKKAADLLQQFFNRLVSAFFGFASWIQRIAQEKKFSVKEMSFELPSFEFSILMVGPFPIPVPKLTTPKLTATFIPVSSVSEKNT
jgi:hypothetical protein